MADTKMLIRARLVVKQNKTLSFFYSFNKNKAPFEKDILQLITGKSNS